MEKFFSATTRLVRSGWLLSTPVSSTAIVTPVPSYPASQASGAWICRVFQLGSAAAFWIAFSQTVRRPDSAVAYGEPGAASVSAVQTPAAASSGAVTDSPPSAVKVWVTSAPSARCSSARASGRLPR